MSKGLLVTKDWDRLHELKATGFVQTAFGSVSKIPFVVRVSLPWEIQEGVPFYIYVSNKEETLTVLISNEIIVNRLVQGFTDSRSYFCWAEVITDGRVNFDTKTFCPGW